MKQTIKGFLTILLSVIFSTVTFAQVTTSSISGLVEDEKGEPLVGAAVVAVHTPSGSQYYAVANEKGRFNIGGMRPGGPYQVEISYLGMGTVKYDGITLNLGEPLSLGTVMKTSENLEAAVLTAEGSFSSSLTGAGSNYDLTDIQNVPTIDRSLYDVAKFSPMANLDIRGGISFTGTNNRYNNFQIDGAVANDSFGLSSSGTNGGQTGANPISIDAIEEIQVSVAPFDVRQSGFTGGAINAVTKSGTNSVKGSFYSHFNNQDFIGSTPGEIAKGTQRAKYGTQLTQVYGFTVGAPVIKDKLFIFVSAEYDAQSSPNIYTPKNGSYDAMPFENPLTLADGSVHDFLDVDVANAVIDHYRKTYAAGIDGFSENIDQHQLVDDSINALARIDWNINKDNSLMVRYQFMKADADRYGSVPAGYYFGNSGYMQSNLTHSVVAELNSRVSDMVSNQFRATAVIVRDHRTVGYKGAYIYIDDDIDMAIGTEMSSGANRAYTDTYTISDNVSIYAGDHNITVGTHNEIYSFENAFIQYAFGGYTFASIQDYFDNKVSQFNFRYADPTVAGVDGPTWAARTYAAQFGLYAQDEWRPSRNFTLTYGLRADMPLLLNRPTENKAFNETALAKNSAQFVGVTPKATVLVSPRIGFRWYADERQNTLLRGGVGLFTGRVPFVWLSNAYNNTGVEAKSVTVNAPEADFPLTSNPYDKVIIPGYASAGGKATINTLSGNFKYPQTLRANLGFEQKFGSGWRFVFDAVYSKSFNNVFFSNLALSDSEAKAYAVNADVAAKNPSSVAAYYNVSKDYSAVVALENTNKGYSYTLSGQIAKTFDFGLDLMASYTFGHSYSVNDGLSSVALTNWRNYTSLDSRRADLSYSYFDRPHKIMGVVSYTSPMYLGRFKTSVSLVYEGGSGQRYSYVSKDKGNFNGDGDSKTNMLMYIPTSEEITQMTWTDPAAGGAEKLEAFIQADRYLSANRGRFSERFGGITKFENHFDLHVAQDFYYDKKNGRKIQFVVDFLNIGNLFNRNWGLYADTDTPSRQVLVIDSVTKDDKGNVTPSYSFVPYEVPVHDFMSRWRCQIGLRLTF